MALVDTHCHLNHESFRNEIEQALERARAAGIERLLVVGYNIASSREAVALAENHSCLWAAVGVHPHEASSLDVSALAELREMAGHERVAAFGEIGLDYHYDHSPRELQRSAFRAQLDLALAMDLPVVIHCRAAYGETLRLLGEAGAHRGVMHCWGGSMAEAEQALALGFHLGIGGTITFKNAAEVRSVAAKAPADRLLLETDAPYLAPVPQRGKRNEPAFLIHVRDALAAARGVPGRQLALETSRNARRLFWGADLAEGA